MTVPLPWCIVVLIEYVGRSKDVPEIPTVFIGVKMIPVSYTHLDVYKRQLNKELGIIKDWENVLFFPVLYFFILIHSIFHSISLQDDRR